jgi:hypothetical protein
VETKKKKTTNYQSTQIFVEHREWKEKLRPQLPKEESIAMKRS